MSVVAECSTCNTNRLRLNPQTVNPKAYGFTTPKVGLRIETHAHACVFIAFVVISALCTGKHSIAPGCQFHEIFLCRVSAAWQNSGQPALAHHRDAVA